MTAPQNPYGTPQPDGPDTPAAVPPGGGAGPPTYGAPAYGTAAASPPPYGTAAQGAPRNGLGTAALILGILAVLAAITVFGGIVFGLLAIVLGLIGRGRAKRGEATNAGVAVAGVVIGALGLLISVGLIAFGLSLFNSDSGRQYQDCLRSAGSDQAAINRCAQEFSNSIVK